MVVYFFISLCIAMYAYYCLKHWSFKGVPYLSIKFPFLSPLYLVDGIGVVTKTDMNGHYREMKSKGYRYAGIITSIRSVLIVRDPKLIRDMLLENKDYFDDRGFHYTDSRYEPLIEEVITLDGSKWQQMSAVLSPDTLPDNLKPIFGSIQDVSSYLVEAIGHCASERRDIDVKELFACFTTDVITYHCFKLNCYSYKQSRSKFCDCQSDKLYMLGLRTAEESVSRSLYNKIRKYMKYREAGEYKHIDSIGLNLSMEDWSKDLDEPLMTYQMVCKTNLFFYLSFDVSSTTLIFAVYELCRNAGIQENARREINDVLGKHPGLLTWESLQKMEYLGRVINETLRLYPPAANLVERCWNKGYKLGDTGHTVSSLTDVVVPLFSLHRDGEYFKDPETFDPERFDRSIKDKHPPFFMPYGEGPRQCGSIQACVVQAKIGLVRILREFRLSISPRTHLPLRLNPQAFLKSDDVLYINAEKI